MPPLWYHEEIENAMRFLALEVANTYYGGKKEPTPRRLRRGHPQSHHDVNCCEACAQGFCAGASRLATNKWCHQQFRLMILNLLSNDKIERLNVHDPSRRTNGLPLFSQFLFCLPLSFYHFDTPMNVLPFYCKCCVLVIFCNKSDLSPTYVFLVPFKAIN